MATATRESFRLAVPLILSNLTVPLLGMVDTAVAGRLEGAHQLGAVALGGAVLSVIAGLFNFFRVGTSGFTAQAVGRNDSIEIRAVLLRSLGLAALAGGAVLLLAPMLLELAIKAYAIKGALLQSFQDYLSVRLLGMPAILINLVIVGWFMGRQNPYVPLVLMVLANGLNAGLDVYLVFVLGFGVDGIAWASVAADYAGLCLGASLACRTFGRLAGPGPGWTRLADAERIWRFLGFGRDLVLRMILMQVAFFGFTAIGARQGELMLAVNAVLMNFFMLQSNGLDGFADATEAMTGKAFGKRNIKELRDAFRAGFINGLSLTALLALLFWTFGQDVVDLLTTLEDVRTAASPFLIYIALLPLVSVTAFICDGLFFGATRGGDLRNSLAIAALVFALSAAALVPNFGNHGLWLAFLAFLAARGAVLLWIYRSAGSGIDFLESSAG